jgi:hypothetical protein
VYFAADGSDCDATVGVNEAFTFYILAILRRRPRPRHHRSPVPSRQLAQTVVCGRDS